MYHDGEALQSALKESGVPLKQFAEQLGVHRNTVNRWFDKVVIPHDTRLDAAKALHMRPEDVFPRLADKVKKDASAVQPVGQPAEQQPAHVTPPATEALRNCQEQIMHWQTTAYENLKKSYENLERYNALLVEHNRLLSARSAEPKTSRAGLVAQQHS